MPLQTFESKYNGDDVLLRDFYLLVWGVDEALLGGVLGPVRLGQEVLDPTVRVLGEVC